MCISANMNLNASLSPAFNKHRWRHIRHSVVDFCNAFYQQFLILQMMLQRVTLACVVPSNVLANL